ncbi:hypothetical protein KCV07_g325, partial [Aureobasidium melanogenum]
MIIHARNPIFAAMPTPDLRTIVIFDGSHLHTIPSLAGYKFFCGRGRGTYESSSCGSSKSKPAADPRQAICRPGSRCISGSPEPYTRDISSCPSLILTLHFWRMAYSRIEPDRPIPRLSVDLAQDAHISYEGDQWLPGHSASSSAVTAVEVQAAIDHTNDRQESTPVKHGFTTFELEQTTVDGPVKSAPDNFARSWWREILAIMLSIASLLSTAGVLFAYQNQPLSSWKFRYLPNTVVSQLITISRSALMLSTASCVSQIFWLHIKEKPRALSELQAFDDASRGPAGAIAMLAFPTRYRVPALIGSLITLATLLMEPFGQQEMQPFQLHKCMRLCLKQFLVVRHRAPNRRWHGANLLKAAHSLTSDLTLDTQTQAAIVNSIFGVPSANPFTCLTNSDCSWNDTVTLGVYPMCANVTSITKVNCSGPGQQPYICNYTTPGGFALQTSFFDTSAIQQYGTRLDTAAQTNYSAETELMKFATIVKGGLYDITPEIFECTLSWCAKVYQNITAQGASLFAQTNDYPLSFKGNWFEKSGDQAAYAVYEAGPGFPASLNATFTLQVANMETLAEFLTGLLNTGSVTQYAGIQADSAELFSIGTAILSNPSIPYMAENIATGLTNTIRNLTNLTNNYIIQHHGDSTVQVLSQLFRVRKIQYLHEAFSDSDEASGYFLGCMLFLQGRPSHLPDLL